MPSGADPADSRAKVKAAAIQAAVDSVRCEIAAACARVARDPNSVRLIAVTKNQEPEVIAALVAAGVHDLGENRIEHQSLMHAAAHAAGLPVRFHAIGRVQGRQLAKLAPMSACLHSLCDRDHVPRLARACAGAAKPFPVYLQVNTSGEAAKAGCAPELLAQLLADVRAESTLEAIGLMTMAEEGAPEIQVRQTFSRLRQLAGDHGLPRLSMGMSQDFVWAIEEGATDIRVGTRLFS